MASTEEIDDSLYSRQRYVLGDSAMKRMAKSNVLLVGLGGLGLEIAKNVVLAGVKSLTILDNKVATYMDLGAQFYLKESDIQKGKNRADTSCAQIAELNPYVTVKTINKSLNEESDLSFLSEYQCVVLTEANLATQKKVNAFCRSQSPSIQFIAGDVYGVFCSAFCDFGDDFEVVDQNGEEPRDTFLSNISKDNPGKVTTLDNKMHGLEDGDTVTFKEVKGMSEVNGNRYIVKVLSSYDFTICDTSGFSAYEGGGIVCQVKVPKKMSFESLEKQIASPSLQTPDLSKFEAPLQIHLGLQALHLFYEKFNRLPNVYCDKDAESMIGLAKEANEKLSSKVDSVDEKLVKSLSFTCQGSFAPLCAALGGIIGQEVLKSLTGKFTPLQQWLHLDAVEVMAGLDNSKSQDFQPRGNRYDALRICVGEEVCQKLAGLKLFMVGCGAIGCEMLKNYATLGISSQSGLITITDNDLIEKSNLNRQFLFRPRHIRKPKSTTAAGSAIEINPDLKIEAQQHKVCPQTESTVYTDQFFTAQDIVVNALDNVEARRYMDSRCVTNQRALLESGTMGAKGHVQVIVPHITESYTSQRDPLDEDVPYCTLKSFPATIEHCIQWARDKFESSFAQKPALFSKFWSIYTDPADVITKLSQSISLEGGIQVSKLAAARPKNWQDCVTIARLKFEKYFNHRAKQLLHSFPLDTKMQDGSWFWQSPKRPPTPVEFDIKEETHVQFVSSCARLYADACKVKWKQDDMSPSRIAECLSAVKVPPFVPKSKQIVTDESAKKPEAVDTSLDELVEAAQRLQSVASDTKSFSPMNPAEFEKDDDSNGHIDFITAASNLRAMMYNIEPADRFKTKRIAGRIVPAIATTTAAVAGLVTIELVKVIKNAKMEDYKNCFMNLGLPVFLFSEPGPVEKTKMSNGTEYTIWDRWEVQGQKEYTLQHLINALKDKYGVEAAMVVQGVKMIYVPIMPGHKKRLGQPLTKFLKATPGKNYVDLVVSYSPQDPNAEEEMGPPVRYYL